MDLISFDRRMLFSQVTIFWSVEYYYHFYITSISAPAEFAKKLLLKFCTGNDQKKFFWLDTIFVFDDYDYSIGNKSFVWFCGFCVSFDFIYNLLPIFKLELEF